MLLAAAENASPYAFDAVKDNLGMALIAVVVLVIWLLFRKMLELSERRSKDESPPPKK